MYVCVSRQDGIFGWQVSSFTCFEVKGLIYILAMWALCGFHACQLLWLREVSTYIKPCSITVANIRSACLRCIIVARNSDWCSTMLCVILLSYLCREFVYFFLYHSSLRESSNLYTKVHCTMAFTCLFYIITALTRLLWSYAQSLLPVIPIYLISCDITVSNSPSLKSCNTLDIVSGCHTYTMQYYVVSSDIRLEYYVISHNVVLISAKCLM